MIFSRASASYEEKNYNKQDSRPMEDWERKDNEFKSFNAGSAV